MSKKWYVVHAYSGFEKNVSRALQERIELSSLQDFFGEIMVPVEEVVEMRGGQKRRSERKFFPGYVLVEMELNDDTWHLVKETPRSVGNYLERTMKIYVGNISFNTTEDALREQFSGFGGVDEVAVITDRKRNGCHLGFQGLLLCRRY